jgi:O-antigen/teichoic acid export membrane protein
LATITADPVQSDGSAPAPAQSVDLKHRRPSVGESVVRGALANLSSQPFSWGASLLAAIFVPRLLGSESLGQLTIALTIGNLSAVALDLGIVDFLTRRVAQNPNRARKDAGMALTIQFLTFTIGSVVIAIVAPRVAPQLVNDRLLYLALMTIVVGCAQSVLLAAMRGLELHVRYAWFTASKWVIGTVGTLLVLFVTGDVVLYMVSAVVLCALIIAGNWKLSGLRPAMPRLDQSFWREAREFVRGGLPFVSWNLTMNVYGFIDRILLGFMVPASQIGWYSAASRIIGIPVFIPSVLITPLFPALSRSVKEPAMLRSAISHTLRIAVLCTVPLSAGVYVIAPVIPDLLGWGSDYVNSIPLMMIMSVQMPIVAVDMVLGTVIMAIGRERTWVKVGLAATLLNIGANLVAIPYFAGVAQNGPIGSSLVTVLTELWMFAAAVAIIPKQLLDSRILWISLRVVIASVAAAVVATALMSTALLLAAVGGAITYIALAIVLRVVSADDARYVAQRLSRKRA